MSVFDVSVPHSDDTLNNFFINRTTSPPSFSSHQILVAEPPSQPLSNALIVQPLLDPPLPIAEPPPVPTRRSTRSINHLFTYKIILVMLLLLLPTLAHLMTLKHLSLIPIWSLTYHFYLMSISSNAKEPEHFFQAVKDPTWREAMDKEVCALERNDTWVITPLPPGKTPIGCKWVYKIKLNPNGSVQRYKARLVTKGYTQREGLDFLETFYLVAKTVSIRVLLALAAAKGWPLH